MESLVILVCICCMITTAQNTLSQDSGSQHYNPDFIAALQRQARPVAARSQHYNTVSNSLHQDLKTHQLQLQQHEQEVQRHLQQEYEAILGNFKLSNQQQALEIAHEPQNQKQYYLNQQQYQQQALETAHEPQNQKQYYLNQQQYQQEALETAHEPQNKQQYYLKQQQYQQQALQDANQPQELEIPKNYHPSALVHKVNIGPRLHGDYDFAYDTGKGSFGQSFRTETRFSDGTVKGSYGYIDGEGRQRTVNYIAGKGGFVAEGDIGPYYSAS
ncbi:uncharacterized protein LOC143252334 [Tachypleus tridentatus]|uniref:uncharacterized protein LOC143252334 n=1 Tax=Tachypleus tridentatus TaxID=6853 RepID=UPI003FD2DD97